jgi:putative nucleotidyltransferase with HDIG domain
MRALERLLEIIQDVSAGKYSNDIMSLTDPGTPEPVRIIAEAMGLMMVKVEAREYHLEMLISELKSLNEKIRKNTIKTVSTMANALAARDPYTKGHTERVANLAEHIAMEMGLESGDIEYIRLGGLLHDIGKIGFPDYLFQPHEARNPPEMVNRIIKHPAVGADILHELDFLGPALEYVRSHHERPDGKGYPRRLKNTDIPLGAKIIAVADSFDAMTTERPYQKAMTPNVALEIFKRHAGEKWDAECVKALGRYLTKLDKAESSTCCAPQSFQII